MRDTRFSRTVLAAVAVCLAATLSLAQQPATVAAGTADGPMPAFEPPLLDLIYAPDAARPSALRVAVKTERFRAGSDGWFVPVVLSVDPADLVLVPAGDDAVDLQVDALALVSDAGGRVVAKLSRSARYRASRSDAAAAGAEPVAFTCPPARRPLAPGAYTLQVCVRDPASKRATVVRRTFTLPEVPTANAPSLSSLVLARRADAAAPGAGLDLFAVEPGVRVVPSANGRFAKARGDRLIAFYKLSGPPGVQYQARVQFLRDGKAVAATPVATLPAIGASGELCQAPVVALDGFAPGIYRAVVQLFAPGSPTPLTTAMTPFLVDP